MRRVRESRRVDERGAAFIIVVLLSVMSVGLVGAFLATSLDKVQAVELQVADTSAYNAAESGLAVAIEQVWQTYRSADPGSRVETIAALDGRYGEDEKLELTKQALGRSQYSVRVNRINAVGGDYADVEFVARGENGKAAHTLVAVVRFGRKPSAVFNHAYFINNYGWLWGAGITANGDVRSNGNFSLRNPFVNGDVIASENAELGAAGVVEGSYRIKDIGWYNAHYAAQVRPTNPSAPSEDLNGNGELDDGEDANENGVLDTYVYDYGFEGTTDKQEKQAVIDMPYLGDLQVYRDLAAKKGGTLEQGGAVLVSAVLGDDYGEEANLLAIGTKDQPIEIDGPVVVTNDVVLRGYITGRGTIYAGRNIHVIGDLMYVDPPVWPKPLVNQAAAKAANESKDLVGLAAKGSIILGDYTQGGWQSTTRTYQRPSFTQPYVVDPTDDANGYVSWYDYDGNPVFDGDYTAYDGGKKWVDAGHVKTTSRRFFESSFSDAEIKAAAGNQVRHIDAVLYTNHMITGKIGACTINGTLVSRDEALIYSGSIDMNYDIRIRDGGYEYIDIYLPREPTYRILYWSEGK